MTGYQNILFGFLAAAGDIRSPLEVFDEIFQVFLVLGTAIGIIVIIYILYHAYKYRDGSGNGEKADIDRPQLGEIPTGGGDGKKLFVSFSISAVIVLSLLIWTYGWLMYVDTGPAEAQDDALEITIEGYQFGWEFQYPNGYTAQNELRLPEDEVVQLTVTSRDVFHNFGIPALRVKTDALPGEENDIWVVAEDAGTYEAVCYELCGAGHSYMTAEVIVMEPDAYDEWLSNAGEETNASAIA